MKCFISCNHDMGGCILISKIGSGKLVLCGIGKSGLISRKGSATLSSVGIASFFLHPSEAAHGDLGQISKKDILLILSYSGETEELKNIIQYCNRFSIPIIGCASKENSLLLRASDIKIIFPKMNIYIYCIWKIKTQL